MIVILHVKMICISCFVEKVLRNETVTITILKCKYHTCPEIFFFVSPSISICAAKVCLSMVEVFSFNLRHTDIMEIVIFLQEMGHMVNQG